jgi:1-deoxy-D-xylulose-5-phosphate synthase
LILERISAPDDIRKIDSKDYDALAAEIRAFLLEKISQNGGHLSSNLGTVELTMALFLSFAPPKDKIIWDVGHQSYTHKILSGRRKEFDGLRTFGGIAGFPKSSESSCDAFNTGHSSTSISAGLGIVQARDVLHEDFSVVSVIGDGALTGGMAYEALNNASRVKKNFIIVLNDNRMSIEKNVGGMSAYLNRIRTADSYTSLKKSVMNSLEKIPSLGEPMIRHIRNTKNGIKQLLIPGMLFENMGITYLGPVDGHNIREMTSTFEEAKKLDHAVLIHVLTQKGPRLPAGRASPGTLPRRRAF